MSNYSIVELTPDNEQQFVEILCELGECLILEEFQDIVARARENRENYRFVGAELDGEIVAVTGYRVEHNLKNGGMLFFVEDLVTRSSFRSKGAGKFLLSYVEDEARRYGSRTIELNSGTWRKDAHRFYLRERYTIDEFRFRKIL